MAPRYPAPKLGTIVEPFAGAAGYSTRYSHLNVILIDSFEIVAGIWDYLIHSNYAEIMRIPVVECVDDLPDSICQEARWLVGFSLGDGGARPYRRITPGRVRLAAKGRKYEGWCAARRERIARQVQYIKHWIILHGSYADFDFGGLEATWFIDPPYNNVAGRSYPHSDIDYSHLRGYCESLSGQVIVCENEGADWMRFEYFHTAKNKVNSGSREVINYRESVLRFSDSSRSDGGHLSIISQKYLRFL